MNAPGQRRDAQRNRALLLTAAREVFASQGLDVTLDEIARHAGVGVGTAYRNFDNKDVLIDALLVERMDELVTVARDCLQVPDPWLGLRGFLETSLAMQAADRGLKQVLFAHSRGHQRVDHARECLAPAVGDLVQRAKDAGVVRQDVQASDIPMITVMVGAAVDFCRDVDPARYSRYLDMLLEGLRPQSPAPGTHAMDDPVFEQAMARWHAR